MQASLVNGAQALTSCATIGIVIQLFLVLRNVQKDNADTHGLFAITRHTLSYALLLAPFAAFAVFTIVSVALGSPLADDSNGNLISDSNLALPGVFYCLILLNAPSGGSISDQLSLVRASFIFASTISLISLCLEVAVAAIVFKQRSLFRRLLPNGWLSLLTRVAAFSLYRAVALGLNLAVIIHPDELFLTGISKSNLFNGVIDFVQAAIPLVAFLIFASERDVWSAWRSTESWTWQPWKELSDPRTKVKRKNSDDASFAAL